MDDISVLAVENCIIRELPTLFEPQMVYDLTNDDVLRLATESEQTRVEREQCAEKVSALEAALSDLRRLDKHHCGTQSMAATLRVKRPWRVRADSDLCRSVGRLPRVSTT